jgi:hypothetical protein
MKKYTFYKVIETSEGIEKDINEIFYTTSIEEVKRAYQYINDTTHYDKRFNIEIVCEKSLNYKQIEIIDELLDDIYIYELKRKLYQ